MEIEKTNGQKRAEELFFKGKNIELWGFSGTGKTWLLNSLIDYCTSMGRKVLNTATTGMAASSFVDGRTIHSVLGFVPGEKDYDYIALAKRIEEYDMLIIDEMSMLNTEFIDHMVKVLEELDRKPQLVFAGDFFQLPPVRDPYYPFMNKYWEKFNLQPVLLTEVVRQEDKELVSYLNKLRLGDKSCIGYFNKNSCQMDIPGAINLCARNDEAARYNTKYYDILSGKESVFNAMGDIDNVNFEKTRIQRMLKTKKGMRVMATRNDRDWRYQNGSLGTIVDLDENAITVRFDTGEVVDIERVEYFVDNIRKGMEQARIMQFPLIYGYAVTIHKSQGQTFDFVNVKAAKCWESGHLYVALSRARTIQGMHLVEPIRPESLKTDPRVIDYYKDFERRAAA